MSFTYNPATPAGQVRLLIADTDATNYLFEDAELSAFLTMASQSVNLAAATAYETLARSRAKLAKVISQNSFRTEKHASAEFLALAERLRNGNLYTLQTAEINTGNSGEYLDEYRPEWRGLIDPPVVE